MIDRLLLTRLATRSRRPMPRHLMYAKRGKEDGTLSKGLFAAKSRLAPLKAMSISRLETIGALAGLRLVKQWRFPEAKPHSGSIV